MFAGSEEIHQTLAAVLVLSVNSMIAVTVPVYLCP